MASKQFLIDQASTAYLLGCDSRTVQTYGKRAVNPLPVVKQGKRGTPTLYDPHQVLQWAIQNELAKVIDDDGDSGIVLNLEAQRARLASEQADRCALENQIKRSEYAPIEALQFAIADFAGQAKSIFEGLPKRIKNSLPSLRAREIKILEREIVKVRNAVASIQINFDTE